ncbi:MAG: adenylate/guanylate cyclase domain-containing protein, partial [Desulfobacterales bacterium]
MNCPKCLIENPDDNKFCRECGTALLLVCDGCGHELQAGDKFCGQCGQKVFEESRQDKLQLATEGERKHVTVLFSDLSGYTAMSEKLDPEEVKDITGRIFGDASKIIAKYDGFVEKYAGDAVMALFGVPSAHEDDPIRAIKTAREIHDRVGALSPQIEGKIGQPISMHSGINSGLVVTGELDLEKGIHGVAGDTINVAARLSNSALAGDILVGHETYKRSEGYFQFEDLAPVQFKGKSKPVQVYKFQAVKEQPQKVHRLHGLRARLIGRKAEMAQLAEAVENMKQGKGAVISIVGTAGTGKSRLVEEFKASLDLKEIQWREGNAYAYAQNIPYIPIIDLI